MTCTVVVTGFEDPAQTVRCSSLRSVCCYCTRFFSRRVSLTFHFTVEISDKENLPFSYTLIENNTEQSRKQRKFSLAFFRETLRL